MGNKGILLAHRDRMENRPRAVVRKIDGQIVLDDPDALAMVRAIEKCNLKTVLDANAARIAHFKHRAEVLGRTPNDTVIVVLAVDDKNGGAIADRLMPGHNWQEYRDRGQIPFARGLAGREGIESVLNIIDKEAAAKLRTMKDLAVVVVDRGVAEVFAAPHRDREGDLEVRPAARTEDEESL